MASESAESDHANPFRSFVERLLEERRAEQSDFLKCFRMKKREKFCGRVEAASPIETLEPIGDFIDRWWIETRGGKHFAKGVAIGPGGDAAPEGGLQRCGAAAHEGIENHLARLGKLLDEIGGESGLEAGAVGNS